MKWFGVEASALGSFLTCIDFYMYKLTENKLMFLDTVVKVSSNGPNSIPIDISVNLEQLY